MMIDTKEIYDINVCNHCRHFHGFGQLGCVRCDWCAYPKAMCDNVKQQDIYIAIDTSIDFEKLVSPYSTVEKSITSKKSAIKKVIFNEPATIVIWADGSKTIVKCLDGEKYDKEKGLAMAISKKVLGNSGSYYDEFKKWCRGQETYDKEKPINEENS